MTQIEELIAKAKEVTLDRTMGGASSTPEVAAERARDNMVNPKFTAQCGNVVTSITADEYRTLKKAGAKTNVPKLLEP